jgi:cellulose synthase/poly-beta-1,6-N-acetylglucosamine synthase-like glycosyltransferase
MSAADWVWTLLFVVLVLPVTVLFVEVVCAVFVRKPTEPMLGPRPTLVVLIPAHNESGGLLAALSSLHGQLSPEDRVLVVADNCTDDTASVAKAGGAEVIERRDEARRGKSYALDFGVRHLDQNPPQLVIIVDADCEVAPGTIDRIARVSAATGRPVQALYLMKAPPSASKMVPIAEFAWIVKNLVRALGYSRLGLPCQLMGTGMAFPWPAIRSVQLASGHIVEDLKMGLDFARAGTPPLFCPEALVSSYFPANEAGSRSQRTRWEHGHLAMIFEEAPRLLWDGVRGKGVGLFALALDMCVPPLALLALAIMVSFGISIVCSILTSDPVPPIMMGIIAVMFGAAVGLSWLRFGRQILPFDQLLLALVYAFRKVPLYAKFVIGRQAEWVRSKRDKE